MRKKQLFVEKMIGKDTKDFSTDKIIKLCGTKNTWNVSMFLLPIHLFVPFRWSIKISLSDFPRRSEKKL